MLVNYYKASRCRSRARATKLLALAGEIRPMVADVAGLLQQARARGESLLFEGAQGALLDIDHGTYPYVTSSNCLAGAAAPGSGIGPQMLDYVLGIVKAYTTRVGTGPFPTELTDDIGAGLAKRGNEFGSVTGRPRRCGWLDIAALKRSLQLNGVDGLCITKLDVLDGMDEIKLCTSYVMDGVPLDLIPTGAEAVARCMPVYETMPGWQRVDGRREIVRGAARQCARLPASASRRSPACRSRWCPPVPIATRRSSSIIRFRLAMRDAPMNLHVSWDEYNRLVERLALIVHESGFEFNQIICVARGGLRVGDVLSRIFEHAARDPVHAFVHGRGRHDPRRARDRRAHDDDQAAAGRPRAAGRRHGRLRATRSRPSTRSCRKRFPHITALKTAVLWWKACSVFKPDYLRRAPRRQSVDPPAVRGLRHVAARGAEGASRRLASSRNANIRVRRPANSGPVSWHPYVGAAGGPDHEAL